MDAPDAFTHLGPMSESRSRIGWANLSSTILLIASAGLLAWTAIRTSHMIAEIDALNPGMPGYAFPVDMFVGGGLALCVGVALQLFRKPGFAAAVAIGQALFTQIIWIGMTH